jgi:lipopolysaccharide transport system ATP-binding protein
MKNYAIQIENLSKSYEIGVMKKHHDTLRDTISAGLKNTLSKKKNNPDNIIWALKDISFNVHAGEAMGIIGRNGAGKSTLLKILSQITEPTTGKAIINGRVGSLLEVGTGFHWELTGRENIYLNGAILGMTRKEIERKFDEIVSFAEIEKFLDTPVKRYSSGMFVRLGFAVAAHLEPEILIVDEVLAVGDTEFQKRCLGKMDDIASSGRTVLFVSHNMNVIQRLCNRTVLIDNGKVISIGKTEDVVKSYINNTQEGTRPDQWIDILKVRRSSHEVPVAYFTQIRYSSKNPDLNFMPYSDGPLEMQLRIHSDASRSINGLAISLWDKYGTLLVNVDSLTLGKSINLSAGENEILFNISQLHLKPGIYTVGLWLYNPPHQVIDRFDQALKIEVIDRGIQEFGRPPATDGSVTCQFTIEQ